MSITALHEQVDELGARLASIGSMAVAVHRLADETRRGQVPGALVDVLEEVERGLMLATHDLEIVRASAALERRSLSGAPDG